MIARRTMGHVRVNPLTTISEISWAGFYGVCVLYQYHITTNGLTDWIYR